MARPENPIFGKYRWVADLGAGGMGDVFLAVAQGPSGFSKLQVIKRLRPELAQDPEFLEMFLNEARIAARLNHPNIVQTNEVGEQDGEHFLAMEYLEGQSLYLITRKALNAAAGRGDGRPQRVPLPFHVHVLAEACAGLHHAHDLVDFDGTPLDLVHRDCSPQNVFVTYEGEVKVLDFGIAKAADSSTVTRTGVLKGKVPYMPPEQLEGAPIDRRADVFAMGAMIWEAACGTRLWKGLNDLQIAHRLQRGDIPSPRTLDPNADPALEAICMKALAIRPDDRFQSAAELQAVLEDWVTKHGGVNRRELGRWVAALFVDTRRALRAKIEAELRTVVPSWRTLLAATGEYRATQTGEHRAMQSGEHGAVEPGAITGTSPRSSVPPLPPASVPPRTPTSLRDSLPSSLRSEMRASPDAPVTGVDPLDALPPPSSSPDSIDNPKTHASATLTVPPRRSQGTRGRALIVTALGVSVVAGLVAFVARGRRQVEPYVEPSIAAATDDAPTRAKPLTPAEPTPAAKTVGDPTPLPVVTIEVTPKEAKLFVDGEPVSYTSGSTWAMGFAPGTQHVARAEAPGYASKSEKITVPVAGTVVRLSLDRVGPKSGAAAKPPATPPPAATSAAPTPAPTASAPNPGKPVLDPSDPWN